MAKIAAVQMMAEDSMEKNYRKSLTFIKRAAKAGASMVCFPEGQLTRYIPQYPGLSPEGFAIPWDHDYIRGFCQACQNYHIIASVSVNLLIRDSVFPSMILIDEQGDVLGVTKKNHIVYAPHFYEQDYFTPGNEGFPVFETSIGKVGQIVCFDRHYPESFRACALKGADLIVTAVANEKSEPNEVFQWEIRIAAFQNSLHCLMCNRVGREGEMEFSGGSIFAGPEGNALVVADDQEGLFLSDLNFEKAKKIQEEKQFLSLRKKEVFEMENISENAGHCM